MLAFESGSSSIALNIHFENGGMVDEAINGGQGHGLIGKDLAPLAEGLVGGDQD